MTRREGRPAGDSAAANGQAGGPGLLEEIAAVYRAEFPRFLRVACALTSDVELARDAVQDAFASAIRNRAAYRGEGALEAWLWRAVVNSARTASRRASAQGEVAEGTPAVDDAARPDAGDASALRASIAALPERQRLVLFLRYYADFDYEAIAHALAVRPGTVAASLHAAHARLRLTLEEARP